MSVEGFVKTPERVPEFNQKTQIGIPTLQFTNYVVRVSAFISLYFNFLIDQKGIILLDQ